MDYDIWRIQTTTGYERTTSGLGTSMWTWPNTVSSVQFFYAAESLSLLFLIEAYLRVFARGATQILLPSVHCVY